MKLIGRIVAAALAALFLVAYPAAARTPATPADRWMEIDLYWFDPADVERSADTLWSRYAPLYRDVAGYKGLVLNIGLTAGFVLDYTGNPDQRIALPEITGQEIGHPRRGQLEGDTAARQRRWRAGLEGPSTPGVPYGRWTYRDLRRLTDALRARAARAGVRGLRVAAMMVGSDSAYGVRMPFALAHPESFTKWPREADGALSSSSHFDPANLLRADPAPRAAFPRGIAAGLPVHAFFAAQWGATARETGLDAIMLRDSFSFPRAYVRDGPFGRYIPDVATATRATGGLAALLRGIKRAYPRTLVMMYSTAATAVSDWRANGIDLETIAREGNVDIFVDQTWAGAWGEVGLREQTFWNAPILGWTYQLGYFLQHAAVLANSRVRHYPLVETFDAWESWDTIHTARDRLRWSIWAYSHAGVKTPRGLRMPAGSYISWGNRGRELLSAEDVAFLSGELGAAARDAAQTTDIAGPTLVYSRDVAQAQLPLLSPAFDPRDLIDEQIGSIVKWPLPILSATRAEWLPQVTSDLFLFGATAGLPAAQRTAIAQAAARGQPLAFFGALGAATDPAIAALAGASAARHEPALQDGRLRAAPGAAWPQAILPPAPFDAPPPATRIVAPPETIVYDFASGAGLVFDRREGRNIALWDPVPLGDFWYRPLRDLMNGDPTPFAVAAATLNTQLAAAGALSAARIDVRQTGTVAAWRLRDGQRRILAGNLEEGLRDDADRTRRIALALPAGWRDCAWRSRWTQEAATTPGATLDLTLAPQGSALLTCPR